ncbi:hypothetical protein Tco_0428020 [Tanacetum coccineum]
MNQTQGNSKEVGTPRYLSLVVPLRKVGDEAVHKELGDRMERAATTASSSKQMQAMILTSNYVAHLPVFDQRHPWLRYEDLAVRLRMVFTGEGQQLGGAKRRMTWRQFILALGLDTEQEMATAGFGAYWAGSERVIPDKGILGITGMIAYSISGKGQAPEKVTGVDLFYLRSMDRGTANVLRLAAHFRLVMDEGLRGLHVAPGPERQQAAAAGEDDEAGPADEEATLDVPAPEQAPPPPPPAPQARTMS